MEYKNKHNIPDYLVKVLTKDSYDYEDNVWSASALKMPSRMFALNQLHKEELALDVRDMIPAVYGTAAHLMFENTDLTEFGFEQEKRVYAEVLGQKISGKYDMLKKTLKGFKLHDIKSTSTYKYLNKDFKDYIIQLSIYKWLLSKNNVEVSDEAIIIFIFTDWSRAKLLKIEGYPKLRLQEQPITLMSLEETEEYIKSRIISHRKAMKELPLCTQEELWQKEDRYAVMKKGLKKALKLCLSEDAANSSIRYFENSNTSNIGKLSIEKRVGKPMRCDYCKCTNVCDQYKDMVGLK